MGMPAATITSLTAHGGTVILGFPQVMINFMPASRITDMHVCPMVTGIVPHVGGPFILGAMTVLTGMMPQSRVTDQLVCVGPPDVCVMGAETVLVGEAGAGGAGAAMAGIAAMVMAVPVQASSGGQPSSQLQPNGTLRTAAGAPGAPLPPITLTQAGYPDLPAEVTRTFNSVEPADMPPGTTLYRVVGDPGKAIKEFWTPNPPATEQQWRSENAVGDWNSGLLMAVAQVPAGGLKAWIGAAAQDAGFGGMGTQLWTPKGSLIPGQLVPAPWAGAAQLTQLAGQQAAQGAAALANAAQQAAHQAEQQAQQAVQQAAQGAQQAAQQAAQTAQQAAQQAQQAAHQAEQQAQQAVQQANQAVQQAQQQVQQAAAAGKAAAQQAAQNAQQASQQVQQQAQQATNQASQAANQAQQAAGQASQAAQQAATNAQNAVPRGLL